MSDDLSNRKCVNWLKSWDDVVFNRDGKVVAPTFLKTFKKSFLYDNRKPLSLEEENTRQVKPVLMLYGQTGAGKSTMARVIAKHCGYQVQEVNASDLRTGDQLVELVRNSLSTNAHFTKAGFQANAKPVCLIIDELDGAFGGGAY
jgi:chromosome transmission fidelity protein 18